MALVFPSLGVWGASHEIKKPDGSVFRRRYQDNSKRIYVFPGSTLARIITLTFSQMNQAETATILAFIQARLIDFAQFYVYSPIETFTLDPTGAATLGRHDCDEIIGDTTNPFTQDAQCRYSGSVSFYCIS